MFRDFNQKGGFSVSTAVRTKSDVIVQDMESQAVLNLSEYRAAEFYSETEVQVFPKQLKHLTSRSNLLY
jgi:peroxiredoxin